MYTNTMKKLLFITCAIAYLLIGASANAAPSEETTFFHTDALGSIIAASDEQGDVIWRKTYDPYGNEVISNENGEEFEGQAYTGKPYDRETGLVYLSQRYYDPELRRFMSIDPIGFVASNPTTFNRYAYGNNNPYKYVDPTGMYVETPLEAASIAIGLTSLTYNTANGNYLAASVDILTLGLDGLGLYIPLVPGVTSSAVASYRLGDAVTTSAKVVDDVADAAKGAGRLCFVGGTPVHTKDGVKPIEEIEIGDLVASKNDKTGEVEWKPVVELFRNKDKDVLNIGFASPFGKLETLGVTVEHPFWVDGKGWTNAGDLATGDEITTLKNGVVKVASIASDSKKHTTYNFEVEDFHTYFVGESALWVHNTCIDFDAIISLKNKNFDKLGAAEKRKALSLIDNFQQRFQRGLGVNSLNDIRNVRPLGKGLFEIKATGSGQTGAVRVFLDDGGNVIGFSNKNNQSATIRKLQSLLNPNG